MTLTDILTASVEVIVRVNECLEYNKSLKIKVVSSDLTPLGPMTNALY